MPARSKFRPCIDLHDGVVKQIVGGSLSDRDPSTLKTNFVSSHSPAYYADLFRKNNLTGGHIIKLGPGNDEAAKEALAEWPNGFHLGGGINDENALKWIEAGAEKVIVTSYLFPSCRFSLERLEKLSSIVGKERLVVDISCRRKGDKWYVAMNRWQDLTDMEVNQVSLELLSQYCGEFLIHAADVEGLCQGIDEELVKNLGRMVTIPTTYAGGAKSLSDLDLVDNLSGGKVDLTALDIFGGKLVQFTDLTKKSSSAIKCPIPLQLFVSRVRLGVKAGLEGMPLRRCFNFDQETGEPLPSYSGIVGCPLDFRCTFVHPDSPDWRRAPKSRPRPHYSRDPSPNSTSSYTSARNPARLPSERHRHYNDHPELSSRISDSRGLSSLGSRLTDPEDFPPSSESLVSRISEPSMPSSWASHAMNANDVSSSTWNSTLNEGGDSSSWSSSVTSKPKQFIPPNRPVPTAPASIRNAFGPTAHQETHLPPPSAPGPSPTLNRNISIPAPPPPVAGVSSPSVARKPSISVPPPSPVAVKQSPAFSPKPWPQSPVAPQRPSQPPLSPIVAPLPSQPLPQQSDKLPSPTPPSRPPPPPPPPPSQRPPSLPPPPPPVVSSASISPIQRPTLDVRTSSVPLDHPLSTPTATTQSPLALRPHSPDQKHIEVMDSKELPDSPEVEIMKDRLRMLCRTLWYYQEYKRAELAASHACKERTSYKSHHIGERAQAKLQESVNEAVNKAQDARRKLDSFISKFSENDLWPTSHPQDSRLEFITQQFQGVEKQITDLSEKFLVENSSPEDSITVEQVTTEQNKLMDHFTELESRQDDLENSVDQRLRDLELKQESAFNDLLEKSQMENKQAALEIKSLKEQVDNLGKQHEAIADEIAPLYSQQAEAFHLIQKLQDENEELKKRLVFYEGRHVRSRSEFQAFVDSFEILKKQQTFSMGGRIDQRLLDSTRTNLVMQLRQRIDERFNTARREIEFRMTSAQVATVEEFNAKYGHAIDFLEQLHDHLRNTVNGTNGDITHK